MYKLQEILHTKKTEYILAEGSRRYVQHIYCLWSSIGQLPNQSWGHLSLQAHQPSWVYLTRESEGGEPNGSVQLYILNWSRF